MASVGNLAVEMALNQAKFAGDLGKVVAAVDAAGKRMQASLRSAVEGFVGGVAGVLTVRAFVDIVRGAIDAADRLNDLSEATGIAVETLGGLGFAASQNGSDLEGVARSVAKLNLQIGAARSGSEEAIRTFGALGISIADLGSLSNDDVLFRIADRFADWEDGANKATLGNRLFGKSYAEVIPFLNQGGDSIRRNVEYFRRYGGITEEVARQAGQFNDTLDRLNLLNRAFAVTLAGALLPTLNQMAEAYGEAAEQGDGFKDTAETIAAVLRGLAVVTVTVAHGINEVGKSIGVTAAQAAAVARLEFASAREMGEEFERESAARAARLRKLLDALLNPGSVADAPRPPRRNRPDAPLVPDASADSVTRRVLDGRLKLLDDAIRAESDLLKVREKMLQDHFRDDQIALVAYYDTRRALIADNLVQQVAAYDEQIRLLREAQGKLAKASDREEVENKIADVAARRSKAERDAAAESVGLFREQTRAAQEFRDEVERVAIEMARLNGDTATAAIAAFDVQNRSLRQRFELERQSADAEIARQAAIGLAALDSLRQRTAAQAGFNQLQDRLGQSLERLGIAQQRIALARETGAVTELQSLGLISAANRGILDELRAWERQFAEIVATTSDPAMSLALEQIRLQIDQIGAQTDLVGDRFQGVFRDSFGEELAAVLDGTKSIKDAFEDMGDTIVREINRIAAQNIAQALFGKNGPGGGIGSFFGSLFGGDGGSWLGDLFSGLFGGRFAAGGYPPVGRVSLVGERGPELIRPMAPVQVIPNHAFGGRSVVVTQNFYVSGPMDRHSQSQLAVQAGLGMRRALARDA